MTTSPISRYAVFCLAVLLIAAATLALPARAQTTDLKELRAKAAALVANTNYIDARAPLERLAAATPSDAQVQLWLGFSLLATAQVALTPTDARALRVRARKAFEAAKAAGDDSLIVEGMIDSIPPDGGDDPTYAANPKADAAMKKAETAFAMGNMDEALSYYKETLKYDPTNYAATLYSGDAYMTKGDFANAEAWYQKAISLNPYRETGYRYSATPLMKQKKYDEARGRYIQAWITEPYNRLAISGIVQWAQATGSKLGHPRIEPPKTEVGADGKEKTTISINDLMGGGSQMAWIAYTATRAAWKKEKFAKEFPDETAYRRSMKEEVDALRSVVKAAKGMVKDGKKADPQIQMIEKLDSDGLLEAYVLMTADNEGVAGDHAKYLREHRDKLQEYVVKYVIRENK